MLHWLGSRRGSYSGPACRSSLSRRWKAGLCPWLTHTRWHLVFVCSGNLHACCARAAQQPRLLQSKVAGPAVPVCPGHTAVGGVSSQAPASLWHVMCCAVLCCAATVGGCSLSQSLPGQHSPQPRGVGVCLLPMRAVLSCMLFCVTGLRLIPFLRAGVLWFLFGKRHCSPCPTDHGGAAVGG